MAAEVHQRQVLCALTGDLQYLHLVVRVVHRPFNIGVANTGIGTGRTVLHEITAAEGFAPEFLGTQEHLGRHQVIFGKTCCVHGQAGQHLDIGFVKIMGHIGHIGTGVGMGAGKGHIFYRTAHVGSYCCTNVIGNLGMHAAQVVAEHERHIAFIFKGYRPQVQSVMDQFCIAQLVMPLQVCAQLGGDIAFSVTDFQHA